MASEQNTPADLDYKGYLRIDEMLFIVIHQVFELWFRLMIHEVDQVLALLAADDTRESERLIRRLTAIVRLFIPKLSVLETMIPSDFIKFRDLLKPASGFQSFQFREVEFASGLKEARYKPDPEATARLTARLEQPTLWDRFVGMLERRGFDVRDDASQIQAIVSIYRGAEHDLRMLCESMIEYDEMFSLWREHHIRMAQRMIGGKPGTGENLAEQAYGKTGVLGTMGVDYLASTLNKRFFPVLWAARTEM
jgi:tryptophan 2,3-dioxygenase